MKIPLKNGEEFEIPQEWIQEWNELYYDVPRTLADIRIWCLDNPGKRKTRRGFRAFLGRWIRKSCTKRPLVARPEATSLRAEAVEPRIDLGEAKKRLQAIKALIK